MVRLPRKGFLQSKILPIFGFFPWKCYDCRICCSMRLRTEVLNSLQEHDLASR
jgi:hypothetical protein